jgi:transposase
MESIGIDVHKVNSQVCSVGENGEVIEERRIHTDRERFAAVLAERPKARVLIEASTESEWVARCLEELGHEVIVADPNFAAMYATRGKRVKTDRRDARTLAEACRLGAYRRAHRTSEEQRRVRAELAVRDALVRTRTGYISVVRSLLRREGIGVRSGGSSSFVARVGELSLPHWLECEIAPLLTVMEKLNEEIRAADDRLAKRAKADAVVRHLCTVPGVGVVTAIAFRATLDEAERFRGAHQVECYLGLVPREMSSGEKQHRGRITKSGNARARWLLVEAAWAVSRSRTAETALLRAWAQRIASRRGKRIAMVALARRLAGILFAIWRDGTCFESRKIRALEPGKIRLVTVAPNAA